MITIGESLKVKEVRILDEMIKIKDEQLPETKKKLAGILINTKGHNITSVSLLSNLVDRYSIATLHPKDRNITVILYKRNLILVKRQV